MIKKLIGIVAVMAVIIIIVMTATRSGEYRSILVPGGAGMMTTEAPLVSEPPVSEAPAAVPSVADSSAMHRVDSL